MTRSKLGLLSGSLVCTGVLIAGCGSSDDSDFGITAGGAGGSSGSDGGELVALRVARAGSAVARAQRAQGGAAASAGAQGGHGGGSTCSSDAECVATPATPYCGPQGACVACEEGNPQRACPGGLSCCASECIDTSTDPDHCGGCGVPCSFPNADASCVASGCVISACSPGFLDCDLDPLNGCETAQASGCSCAPGLSEPCYSGPPNTEGVGLCQGGMRTCDATGTSWGPCVGEIVPQADSCLNFDDDDCDGAVNNGYPTATGCTCVPGSTENCYTGDPLTLNVGECHEGVRTCDDWGAGFGLCVGEVTPAPEVCSNGLDEDCNGNTDDTYDLDGDGWTVCEGDCCDVAGTVCADPELVNPGAFEDASNGVDDDCDGTIDNPLGSCDGSLQSNSADPVDYARAIDLCKTTQETPPPGQSTWGVIQAQLLRADGTGSPAGQSRSIRSGFGGNVTPHQGSSLAILSTGNAADTGDTNPGFAPFQGGQDTGTTSSVPGDWLAANGGDFPNAPGCPNPLGGNTGHNPIMLKLRIRVPTNARSFSVDTYFYSAEYPEWVCSPFNDFFVALLDSGFTGTPANPTDKNLAFYDPPPLGAPFYPVGVNLAFGNTGLFRQCVNGSTGCGTNSVPGSVNTCLGTTELAGTGFEIANPPPHPLFTGEPGWCGASNLLGGGTGWLVTRGNVAAGETIEIRFAVWDTGDPWYDSLVLLDNFRWSVQASQPGTGEG